MLLQSKHEPEPRSCLAGLCELSLFVDHLVRKDKTRIQFSSGYEFSFPLRPERGLSLARCLDVVSPSACGCLISEGWTIACLGVFTRCLLLPGLCLCAFLLPSAVCRTGHNQPPLLKTQDFPLCVEFELSPSPGSLSGLSCLQDTLKVLCSKCSLQPHHPLLTGVFCA